MEEALHHPVVPEFICEFHQTVKDSEGHSYQSRVYGIAQGQRIWDAVIVFFPVDGGPMRRTHPEAEHDSRQHLSQWAAAITPAYLEAALDRSIPFLEAGVRGPAVVESAHEFSQHY